MGVSTTSKKRCVTCEKNGGILICDGCQQSFCGKHVMEHRDKLGVQLDCLVQEHDLMKLQVELMSTNHVLFKQIDQWEKESIMKIQDAANHARENLRKILGQSKQRFSKRFDDIREDFQASRVADDYSENDLTQWTNDLKTLKKEIESPDEIEIFKNKGKAIDLIEIKTDDDDDGDEGDDDGENDDDNDDDEDDDEDDDDDDEDDDEDDDDDDEDDDDDDEDDDDDYDGNNYSEKFGQIIGPGRLLNNDNAVQHMGSDTDEVFIGGQFNYMSGVYIIRFKLEAYKPPYRIFLGCTTATKNLSPNIRRAWHLIGWEDMDTGYIHGARYNCSDVTAFSSTRENDILKMIIDCNQKQIKLCNERLKVTSTLNVDIGHTPLPWRLVIILSSPGDCVRMVYFD